MATKRSNQFGLAFRLAVTVVAIFGVLLGAHPAHAQSFSFTTINLPFPDVGCGDINSNGKIVGVYFDVSGAMHAFLDNHGELTTIDFPGAIVTVPTRIDPNGQIVGFYIDSDGVQHGYLDEDGVFSTIDFPGAIATAAIGIKPGGQPIIGFYVDSVGVEHGFLDNQGVFTTLDVPFSGATGSQLIAINPRGQIVGVYLDSSGGIHGFLDDKGVFSTVDVPFPGATFAGSLNGIEVGGLNAINASGEIAGIYFDTGGVAHGFVDDQGVFTKVDVPFPGTTYTALLGNNPRGQLVGYYGNGSDEDQCFLATPRKK